MLRHSISALPNRFSQNRSRVALLSSAVTRTPFVPLGTVRPPQAVVATVSKPTSFWPRLPLCPVSAALAAACAAALVSLAIASECDSDDSHEMVNWSGTHTVRPALVHEPETLEALEALVKDHNGRGQRLRAVGSGLSPNGIGFCANGGACVNLASMDQILSVDAAKQQVTVQAGIKVGDLCERLRREHGLTLPNLASLVEQQVGGFVSVSAHGTGAKLPPLDMAVVSMKVVTPGLGTLVLSKDNHPDLFELAKVSLGLMGVVAEVTLQCVPAHDLLEHTFVLNRVEAASQLPRLLASHRHVRYMWVPFADTVVVVTNDPVPSLLRSPDDSVYNDLTLPIKDRYRLDLLPPLPPTAADAAAPLRNLLLKGRRTVAAGLPAVSAVVVTDTESSPAAAAAAAAAAGADAAAQVPPPANPASVADLNTPPPSAGAATFKDEKSAADALKRGHARKNGTGGSKKGQQQPQPNGEITDSEEELALKQLGMAQLRDELLALAPLDPAWVRAVNVAEAQSWQHISGSLRIGRNVDLLQFDCGGQQWVSEVCYPTGTLEHPTGADMAYMEQLLTLIESHNIPAASPIEQRWSANSNSKFSPACATKDQQRQMQAGPSLADTVHSWVGIIMYLPVDLDAKSHEQRGDITESFMQYRALCAEKLWPRFGATEHWAKVEYPTNPQELKAARARVTNRFPMEAFNTARMALDPKGLLGGPLTDALLPHPGLGDDSTSEK